MASSLSLAGYFLSQSARPRQGPPVDAAIGVSPPPLGWRPLAMAKSSSPDDGDVEDDDKTTAETDGVREEIRLLKHLAVFPKTTVCGVPKGASCSPVAGETSSTASTPRLEPGESVNAFGRKEIVAVAKHVAQLEDTVELLKDRQGDFEAQLNDLRQQCCRVEAVQDEQSEPDDRAETMERDSDTDIELKELREAFELLQGRQAELEVLVQGMGFALEKERKVNEVENMIKLHVMEAWLKVEALEEENDRLRTVVEGKRTAEAESEWAREMIKALESKLESQKEIAEGERAVLRRRVEELEQRVRGCEERCQTSEEELRVTRLSLQESEELVARLTEQNAELALEKAELESEIETINKWTASKETGEPARDAIGSLSPLSSGKVKKLVLEYGGADQNPVEEIIDLPRWSPSQVSNGELPADDGKVLRVDSKGCRGKKFFAMLKQLVTTTKDQKRRSSVAPTFDELVKRIGATASYGDQSRRASRPVTDHGTFPESEDVGKVLEAKKPALCASDMQATSSRRLAVEAAGEELRQYAAALMDDGNRRGAHVPAWDLML